MYKDKLSEDLRRYLEVTLGSDRVYTLPRKNEFNIYYLRHIAEDLVDYLGRSGIVKFESVEKPEAVTEAIERLDKNCGSEAECNTYSFGYEELCEYQKKKEKVLNRIVSKLSSIAVENKSKTA